MAELESIKFIVFDVDGVLTDGTIRVDDHGVESKDFHVRDGFAIKAAMSVGLKVGVLSGRVTRAVTHRMADLGIEYCLQGCGEKGEGLGSLCERAGVKVGEVAYLGDDLIDLPAMARCGYPMAVADAAEEVRGVAKYVTTARGGRGAARECVEHILKGQGKWQGLVRRYGA